MSEAKYTEEELQKYIKAAAEAACRECYSNIGTVITGAIELGAKIGAEAGAEMGAAAAIKAAERERKRIRAEEYDKRFHNTKLLLQHYRSLNEHYLNAVYDVKKAEEATEDFVEIMQSLNSTLSDEELYVESIKRSCIRTRVIMTHVNRMLDIYRTMCEKSKRDEDRRHWRVLEAIYLSTPSYTAGEVAINENIDKRTVYKDIDACVTDLTTLLFGIGGIERR